MNTTSPRGEILLARHLDRSAATAVLRRRAEERQMGDAVTTFVGELAVELHGTAAGRILAERLRQIHDEGFDEDHDDQHDDDTLARAGACYALVDAEVDPARLADLVRELWPWERRWWKPRIHEPHRNLERAGALIVAALDRVMASR